MATTRTQKKQSRRSKKRQLSKQGKTYVRGFYRTPRQKKTSPPATSPVPVPSPIVPPQVTSTPSAPAPATQTPSSDSSTSGPTQQTQPPPTTTTNSTTTTPPNKPPVDPTKPKPVHHYKSMVFVLVLAVVAIAVLSVMTGNLTGAEGGLMGSADLGGSPDSVSKAPSKPASKRLIIAGVIGFFVTGGIAFSRFKDKKWVKASEMGDFMEKKVQYESRQLENAGEEETIDLVETVMHGSIKGSAALK